MAKNEKQVEIDELAGDQVDAGVAGDALAALEREAEQEEQGPESEEAEQAEQDAQASAEQEAEQLAQKGAMIIVGGLNSLIKMAEPSVELGPMATASLMTAIPPVVKKHAGKGQLPEWLQPYKEELVLVGALGFAGVSVSTQIKGVRKERELAGITSQTSASAGDEEKKPAPVGAGGDEPIGHGQDASAGDPLDLGG